MSIFGWSVSIFWLTLLGLIASAVLTILVLRQMFRGKNQSSAWTLILLILCLLPSIMIGVVHPGQGVLAYLFDSPQVREELTANDLVERSLRLAQRTYSVTCPDKDVWSTWSAEQKKTWHDYYASFAQPSPIGEECWGGGTPTTLGFLKPREYVF